MMTLWEAKELYCNAGGSQDQTESEWRDIHSEMQGLVAAKSDRAAGKTILWWDCWDAKHTATAFARRVRVSHANRK